MKDRCQYSHSPAHVLEYYDHLGRAKEALRQKKERIAEQERRIDQDRRRCQALIPEEAASQGSKGFPREGMASLVMWATAYGIMANQAVVQDIGIHPSGANQEKTISDNELELLTSREEVDPANLAFRAEALLQMKLSDEEIRDLPVLLDSEAGGVPGDYVDSNSRGDILSPPYCRHRGARL